MQPEKSEYVVQAAHEQGNNWHDIATYPVADGQRERAIQFANTTHGNPPHFRTRVVRRLISEWVIHTSE